MKQKIILFFITILQSTLLYISYYFFLLLKKYIKKSKFVIGTYEIANNIYYIGKTLENSKTVCLKKSKYYSNKYDYFININNQYLERIYRVFYGPLLLGYLTNKADIFFYIWTTGFLWDRKYDYKFLKSKNKKIVCFFVGDDIRSLKLQKDHEKKYFIDNISTYSNEGKNIYSDENFKKYTALITDRHVDLIFNNKFEQKSYLKSKQYRWRYILNKNLFFKNDSKFKKLKTINVLHAFSNPNAKGTPLIRAAIKKLQLEGYKFNYIELNSRNNKTVLRNLKSSHIVLNQFYASAPGLFGIEAMANHCAVMMSAESSLLIPNLKLKKNIWLETKYWQIYDNLKFLFKYPEKIKLYADNGYDFALKYFNNEAVREYLNKLFRSKNIL